MAVYSWSNLNLPGPQKGFSEDIGLTILRTPMDLGPSKQRRRALKPSTLNLSYLLTTAQVAIVENFIINSLDGTTRFNFVHPRTGATVEVRVVPQGNGTYFTLSYVAPGYYTMALIFEILP